MLDFLADLRRLAITCEFGNFLDEALQDRFVCGLKAEGIQKRLLTEPDLTIARAVEIARGMEAAASETKEFKGSNHNPTSKILYFWDSESRISWLYACDRSSVVNFFPPARVAKRSSGRGRGYLSTSSAGLTVTL